MHECFCPGRVAVTSFPPAEKPRRGYVGGREREEGRFYGGNGGEKKEDVEVKSEGLAADDGGLLAAVFSLAVGQPWGRFNAPSSWRREVDCR